MAISPVNDGTKFLQWKEITNQLITDLGNKLGLTTTEQTDIVSAINELDGEIGTLTTLTTTEKATIVSSINELDGEIGIITGLSTTDKTDIVSSINEVDGDIGDITTLSTTDKTDIVSAINELDDENGDLSTLTTTEQGSVVGSINELDSEIGDITTLTTTDKSDLVSAINEVDAKIIPDVYYPNQDNGRFATESTITATTFNTGMFGVYNSSLFTEGHKFIDDNANNGGGGASMGADAIALTTYLGTLGRTNLVNGFEYFIMDIDCGAGSNDGIVENTITYYPCVENGSIYLGAIGDIITWSGFIKNYDGSNNLMLGNANTTVYIDGVNEGNQYELTDAKGWIHCSMTMVLETEYFNLFPAINGASTGLLRVALSSLYRAENTNIHLGVVE